MKTTAAPNPALRRASVVVALCLSAAAAALVTAPAAYARIHEHAPSAAPLQGAPASVHVHGVVGHEPSRGEPLRLAQGERPRVSLDDAVAKVRSRYKGRVIRAETRYSQDGKATHYVKLLSPDGHVRTIRVDGRSGRIR